ncbi:MAG: hypothetical protein J0L53_03315 [Spirochaetes bacterium]|nr:hypothetical protein [Spirochaetota bacterium]
MPQSSRAAVGAIRKIEIASGNVTTIAGDGSVAGGTTCPGTVQALCKDGVGRQSVFSGINGMAYHNGNLYISEYGNSRVRRMNLATGQVDTIAGDGSNATTDNTTGTSAAFNNATGVTVAGNYLYVADFNGHRIRSVSLTAPYAVATVAGTGVAASVDGPSASAAFHNPDNLTSDGRNLYVSEYSGNTIRKVDLVKNRVTTIAGNGSVADTAGVGPSATFNGPVGIVSDGSRLWVGSYNGSRIFRIADQGLVRHWALRATVEDYSSDVTGNFPLTAQNSPVGAQGRYNETNGSYRLTTVSSHLFRSTNFTNLPLGTASSTMCVWVRPNALPSVGQNINIFEYGGTLSYTMRLLGMRNNGGQEYLTFRSLAETLDYPFTLSTTNWSHLCMTFQNIGTQWINIYVNGYNLGRQSPANALNTTTGSNVTLGGPMVGGDTYFDGFLADARIYDRVLNEAEIAELAQDADSTLVGPSFNTAATGLLNHYTFDAFGATPSLNDRGPLGLNLTNVNGATAAMDKDGDGSSAYRFDGASQRLTNASTTGIPVNDQPRSICAWISPEAYPGTNTSFIIAEYDAATRSNISIGHYSGNPQVIYHSGGTLAGFNYTVPLNSWTHICAAYNGSQLLMYVNGALLGTQGSINNTAVGFTGTFIGIQPNIAYAFKGKIDDVRVYNNAISQAQVRQLAAQVPAGLAARYDMVDSAAGGSAIDVSGWGNTGTVSATHSSDRFSAANQSYSLNGSTNNIVASGTATTSTDNVTMAGGVRWQGTTGSPQIIINNGNTGSQGFTLYLDNSASDRLLILCGGVTFTTPTTPYYLPTNAWTHLALVRSGSWSLYVNGASIPLGASCTPNAINAPSKFSVGSTDSGAQFFKGEVDDMRVYRRNLSAAEIRALSGYHPMQVTNALTSLRLHLEPNAATYAVGTCTGGSNCVSALKDSSPAGINLAQATGSQQPVFTAAGINGKPALRFIDTSLTVLTAACSAALNSQQMSIFSVFTEINQSGNDGIFQNGASNSGKLIYLLDGPSRPALFDLQTNALNLTGSVLFNNSSETVMFGMDYNFNGSTGVGNMFKNGGSSASSVSTQSGSYNCGGGLLNIGRYYWGVTQSQADYFDGFLGDFIYFDQVLSASDRDIVHCYLSSKYNQPLSTICP